MCLVLGAKACEFHANQVRQRNQPYSPDSSERSQFGCWFWVQMDRSPTRRRHGLHQHVHSRHLTILQPKQRHGLYDLLQILAADDDIDVFSQASSVWLQLFYIEINSQAAGHPILESGGRKRLFYPPRQVYELLQTFLEERI